MKKRTKLILAATTVLETVALLLMVAYAWIETANKPVIQGNNLKISTSTGLLMRLDGQVKDEIDLNSFLGENKSSAVFLRECSSGNGTNVFIRDAQQEIDQNVQESEIRMRRVTSSDANVSYISQTFTLVSEGAERSVWLDSNECEMGLKDDTKARPLRMSLEFRPENGEAAVFVFANHPDIAVEAENGPVLEINILGEITRRASLGNGGLQLLSFDAITADNPFCTLKADESCSVTLRVWLEGTDSACTDDLAGSVFHFKLRFDSTTDSWEG